MSLLDMAQALASSLNQAFGGLAPGRMGVHVAGFDTRDGVRGPALYHVHNGHYHWEFISSSVQMVSDEDPPIREFRAHEDRPPQAYGTGQAFIERNGDFVLFSALFDRLRPLLGSINAAIGITFPYPDSLETRGEYLRFWLNHVKDIYRLSNARSRAVTQPATGADAHIGGPVTVLTISDAGIQDFYAK